MFVPDVYQDRLVKCTRCGGLYVPEHDGHRGQVETAPQAGRLPPEPAANEFRGLDTDHDKLIAMREHAKARGNAGRYDFLAAYANAQTALTRDTWQAALQEWKTAHALLARLHGERAKPLVKRARAEFIQRASDQLVDLVHQMNQEFSREVAHVPEKARRKCAARISATFRGLVADGHATFVEAAVIGQVQSVAARWTARVHA